MKTKWEIFLSQEIATEYKTTVYSLCIFFFYGGYQLIQGRTWADIFILIQMVLFAYVISQIQVLVFQNVDEADHLGGREWLGLFLCSGLYGLFGQVFNWFDRRWDMMIFLVIYMVITHLTIFFTNKIKRHIDSKQLNQQLEQLKKRKETNDDQQCY
ncbi:hypothetical protein BN1356_01651 [Streptococcus varani]|uniref:Uncharacterized protein n=1 Tax=Streptococcus varani TaxID=1608583 RepID=A0A0E4H5G8_9STRE|nr:DUF3021 domain-containing protein [Streptococcus varani]CQR25309.1 hypothetical protein BN1356_01651 [Streptococcus varani]